MKVENNVFPKVVAVGTTVELAVGNPSLTPATDYTFRFFSKVNRQDDASWDVRTDREGQLRVSAAFITRGEYTLEVRVRGAEDILISESFYAVTPEWTGLRPFKGDLHLHTTGSDGKNSSMEMLVRAWELGMDFVAITDHDNYAPSCQAVQEAAALGTGLLVFKGEEIAIRGIGGHVLSLNAARAVGGKRRWTPETDKEYAGIATRLAGRQLVSPLTAESYSTAVWTVTKVREAGGIAVMAHPYWEGSKGKYYPPRCVYEQLLADDLLDAIELMGGSPSTEGNLLAVARYSEEAARGKTQAVVGGSDAHCVDEIGRHFTVVLAETLTEKDIVNAIRERKSVACDHRMGPDIAVFGPFEVVEYVYFLLRVFFPMRDHVCRGADASNVQKNLEELRNRFWHGSGVG